MHIFAEFPASNIWILFLFNRNLWTWTIISLDTWKHVVCGLLMLILLMHMFIYAHCRNILCIVLIYDTFLKHYEHNRVCFETLITPLCCLRLCSMFQNCVLSISSLLLSNGNYLRRFLSNVQNSFAIR